MEEKKNRGGRKKKTGQVCLWCNLPQVADEKFRTLATSSVQGELCLCCYTRYSRGRLSTNRKYCAECYALGRGNTLDKEIVKLHRESHDVSARYSVYCKGRCGVYYEENGKTGNHLRFCLIRQGKTLRDLECGDPKKTSTTKKQQQTLKRKRPSSSIDDDDSSNSSSSSEEEEKENSLEEDPDQQLVHQNKKQKFEIETKRQEWQQKEKLWAEQRSNWISTYNLSKQSQFHKEQLWLQREDSSLQTLHSLASDTSAIISQLQIKQSKWSLEKSLLKQELKSYKMSLL